MSTGQKLQLTRQLISFGPWQLPPGRQCLREPRTLEGVFSKLHEVLGEYFQPIHSVYQFTHRVEESTIALWMEAFITLLALAKHDANKTTAKPIAPFIGVTLGSALHAAHAATLRRCPGAKGHADGTSVVVALRDWREGGSVLVAPPPGANRSALYNVFVAPSERIRSIAIVPDDGGILFTLGSRPPMALCVHGFAPSCTWASTSRRSCRMAQSDCASKRVLLTTSALAARCPQRASQRVSTSAIPGTAR